jgi:hypothetical protein
MAKRSTGVDRPPDGGLALQSAVDEILVRRALLCLPLCHAHVWELFDQGCGDRDQAPGVQRLNSPTRDDPVVVTDRGGGGRRSNIMSALRYAGGRGGGQPDERRIAR